MDGQPRTLEEWSQFEVVVRYLLSTQYKRNLKGVRMTTLERDLTDGAARPGKVNKRDVPSIITRVKIV